MVTRVAHTLIDYVPLSAAAIAAASKSLDMVMHDFDKLFLSEVAVAHPVWQLAAPDQVVAVDLDSMRGGIVDVSISIFELYRLGFANR